MSNRADFETVMGLVFAGKLTPALDVTFPLEDIHRAMGHLESGAQLGKITLAIS